MTLRTPGDAASVAKPPPLWRSQLAERPGHRPCALAHHDGEDGLDCFRHQLVAGLYVGASHILRAAAPGTAPGMGKWRAVVASTLHTPWPDRCTGAKREGNR